MSFSEKMIDILNYGAINLAMAIGYRTGLFDVMDEFDSPRTVSAISDKAALNPRYVQEWPHSRISFNLALRPPRSLALMLGSQRAGASRSNLSCAVRVEPVLFQPVTRRRRGSAARDRHPRMQVSSPGRDTSGRFHAEHLRVRWILSRLR